MFFFLISKKKSFLISSFDLPRLISEHISLIKPTDKPAEGAQREEQGSSLTEVAPQAEENPLENPAEDQRPPLKLVEDVGDDTEKTLSQPDPIEAPRGQELTHKTASVSTQKKISADKEGEVAIQDSLEFQDDPADTDYAPSNYMFMTLFFAFNMILYITGWHPLLF